jgi:hypothetical protein
MSGNASLDGGTVAFILAGLIAFGVGAYLAATGEQGTGVVLMAVGLAFQVMSLARLRQSRTKAEQGRDGQ